MPLLQAKQMEKKFQARNPRSSFSRNETGFRCNSHHSWQKARQERDSRERSWKGARTNTISHKATDGGNRFHRICYPIVSFVLVLLSFLGKISHQRLPSTPIFFLHCKGKIKPGTTHPWWPLLSRCPTLHPPAMRAKNFSVLLFPPQPPQYVSLISSFRAAQCKRRRFSVQLFQPAGWLF